MGASATNLFDRVGRLFGRRVTPSGPVRTILSGCSELGAVRIEAYAIGSGAALRYLGCTEPAASGRFTLEVEGAPGFVLLEGVDADGVLAGSAVVEPAYDPELEDDSFLGIDDEEPPVAEERLVRPLGAASSLEAEVFLACGARPRVWPRVRSRVDESVVEAIVSAEDRRGAIEALAAAVSAESQHTTHAFEEVGLDAARLERRELALASELSAALHRGASGAREAYLEALDAVHAATGASAALLGRVHLGASLAFRATLRAVGALALLQATALEREDPAEGFLSPG